MVRLPEKIAYAKNAAHNQFLHHFEGKVKGRYQLAFLVGIGFVGGAQLRQDIETDLGKPAYVLDEWYPGRDVIFMFDRAVRCGLSPERIGLLSVPAYQRANPNLFEDKTLRRAFELLDQGLRSETSYATCPAAVFESTRAVVQRTGAPIPCGYMVGLLKGLLDVIPVQGTVREIECQWNSGMSLRSMLGAVTEWLRLRRCEPQILFHGRRIASLPSGLLSRKYKPDSFSRRHCLSFW